jgi:DNA-binding NtrC family response regulator
MRDEQARHVSAVVLRSAGYDVVEATSPDDAWSGIDRGEKCDVLVTDRPVDARSDAPVVSIASGRRRRTAVLLLVREGQAVIGAGPRRQSLRMPFSGVQLVDAVASLCRAGTTHATLGTTGSGEPSVE